MQSVAFLFCVGIRLVDGSKKSGKYDGILQVLRNGKWGTVCSTGWDLRDAKVACRDLGYDKVSGPQKHKCVDPSLRNHYEVQCSGDELTLSECPQKPERSCRSKWECIPQSVRVRCDGTILCFYLVALCVFLRITCSYIIACIFVFLGFSSQKFGLVGMGTNCPIGKIILNMDDCKEAAERLAIDFNGKISEDFEKKPVGCYYINDNANFNPNLIASSTYPKEFGKRQGICHRGIPDT